MIQNYKALAKSICMLLHPYVEIAIHDLKTRKIIHLEGNNSKRQSGDPSYLDFEDEPQFQNELENCYFKMLWNGKKSKSISTLLYDQQGDPTHLFCINLEITSFEKIHSLVAPFLEGVWVEQPKSLFEVDWKEPLHQYVQEYISKQGWNFETLKRTQKQTIVQHIYQQGGLKHKNASLYLAEMLGLSRATLYNYLKEKS